MSRQEEQVPITDGTFPESDFGAVADLAYRYSEERNGLHIPHVEVRDEHDEYLGVLVAVDSRLTTDGGLGRDRIDVEGATISHTAVHPSMTASATLVGLWPKGNDGAGEASLHTTQTTFKPQPDRREGSVGETFLRALGRTHRDSTRELDLTDEERERHGRGTILTQDTSRPVTILGTDGTQFEVQVVGRQELDHEVGIRGVLQGSASAYLGTLLRVTEGTIYRLSGDVSHVPVTMPLDGSIATELIKIPEDPAGDYDGSLTIEDNGTIIRTNDPSYRKDALNPRLPAEDVLRLLTSPLEWEEATAQTIGYDEYNRTLKETLSFGGPHERLAVLLTQARAALEASRVEAPLVAKPVGCILVAAALRAMPEPSTRYTLDYRYFNN